MVGLLQGTLADLCDIRKVFTDLRKKLPSNLSFSEEQSVKGVRVIRALFEKGVETLQRFVRPRSTMTAGCWSLTAGSWPIHSIQRSYSCLIQAGCCDVCPWGAPAAGVESLSSSASIRIFLSLPSSSFPVKSLNTWDLRLVLATHTLCNGNQPLRSGR